MNVVTYTQEKCVFYQEAAEKKYDIQLFQSNSLISPISFAYTRANDE